MRLSRPAAASVAALTVAGGLAATALAAPSGLVSTVAGTGSPGTGTDAAQPATSVALTTPSDLAFLPDGRVLVTDSVNRRVRAFTVGGTMSTVAGDGTTRGKGDDGVLATETGFDHPLGLAVLPDGSYLVSDDVDHRVRRFTSAGMAVHFAGSGSGFADGAANTAKFDGPAGMAVDTAVNPSGDVYVADVNNNAIRKVAGASVSTVINTARTAGTSADGATAASTRLTAPTDVAVLPDRDLVVADSGNGRIVRLDRATGTTSTVVSGTSPLSVEPAPDGGFLFATTGDHRIRHVRADGSVAIAAGGGSGGDGSAATDARLIMPGGMVVTAAGQLLVTELGGHRVRLVDIDLRPAPAPSDPPPTTTPSDPPPTTTPSDPPSTTSPDGTAGPRATTPPGDPVEPVRPGAPAPDGPAAAVAQTSDPVRPELGRVVVVAPASGRVLVRRPGASSSVALQAGAEVPVGSVVDARAGSVRLTSSLPGGRTQTGRFWGAQFSVGQRRDGNGVTELALRGGSFAGCPVPGTTARTAANGKPARRLWGEDKGGRFRTRGRSSVATVRGTRWLTEDTCAGTVTRVVEGAVDVRDLRRGVVRRVRAGESLLVRTPGR